MKQLTIQQCEDVNGGILPLLLMPVSGAAVAVASAVSAAIGLAVGAWLAD